jgi:hypothetical protein
MKTLKPSKDHITFKQALEMLDDSCRLASSLPVPFEDKVNVYRSYQNYQEAMKNLEKFEAQKAEIIELFRRKFY